MEAYSGLSQVRISAWSWQICDIQFVPVNVGFGSIATIRPSGIVNEAAIPSQTHHIHLLAKHLLHRWN